MKCKTIIDASCKEELVTIVAKQKSKLVKDIEQLVENSSQFLKGFAQDEIKKFALCDVRCFFIEAGKVYACLAKENLLLKTRLFEIEPLLNDWFVKLNQSCIANVNHVKKFKAKFNGSLMVVFDNGHFDFVSRRQLKVVKEKFGGF